MNQVTYKHCNADQIDVFLNGNWAGLIQRDTKDADGWYIDAVELNGRLDSLPMGTAFKDGRYFFGGTIAEAKEAIEYELNV